MWLQLSLTFFEIDFLLFTGVAGAVHPELNIGDIVIGSRLYQHDIDARPLFPKFHVPLTGCDHFLAREEYLKCAESCITDFINELEDHLDPAIVAEFFAEAPKLIRGTIATGDRFITHRTNHADFIFNEEVAHAVEMEGAAVAQVCHDYHKPFLIIRTISDKADSTASIDFQKFIESISNPFSKGIVQKLLPELWKVMKRVK